MLADLDALVTALYVRIDDLLPVRTGPGRPPRITDSELIALAVAQMFLEIPNDRKFLALARWRLGHLFPYLPKQPGYNKRLRALAPAIGQIITHLALHSPSFCDGLRLLDSTPVPCGQSRETTRRSQLAGHAAYGYCASHSRYFWGFRLYLLCAPDGMPIAFELAPANCGEREVAAEMLARVDLEGYTVMADKGFAGEEFGDPHGRRRRALCASRPKKRARPQRLARAHPPVDRIGLLDLQGTAHTRSPRRAHAHRRLHPRRTAAARPRRRARPQPRHRQPRPPLRLAGLLIRNQPSRPA